ncbi:glycosyltransferase [bacterium]|nr:MAG: glycosyltransferase [bacterium]
MNKQIKISVNIIAKNEADIIANAINSVKDLAEEIIVIDTGSTDETATISTRMGCEVYFHNWEEDFSLIRNRALQYSTCDWVLVIDADEIATFNYEDLPLMQMSDEKIGGINLLLVNHIDEENSSILSKHRYTRIFRNDKSIRFTGRIHEQIRESIEKNYTIYDSDLVIEHFGYESIDKEKLERNTRLLEKDIESDADDWKYFHLAETHFSAGEKEKALNIFEKIVSSPELTELQSERVKTRLGQLYLAKDEYNKSQQVLDFVSTDKDVEGLRKYILGTVMLSTGNIDKSLELYNSSEVEISDLVDKNQLNIAIQGAMQYKSLIENKK